MENSFNSEGDSVDYRLFTTSTDLKDELIAHSTSFIRLYDQRRDRLQRTSESFKQAAVLVRKMHKDIRCLLSVFGGVLGAACGAVAGGVWGTFGAVSAATFCRVCGDINAVGATVGFVGSVLGGAVGGSFSGALGAAVGSAATRRSFNGTVSNVAWFGTGFATGGAIGGIFGGTVGAAGGAVGGAFGALHATRFAVGVVGVVAGYFDGAKDKKKQENETNKVDIFQEAEENFHQVIKPLVEELKPIKMISDKMASSVAVLSVAEQTAKTLAAVTAMEDIISESLTDLTKCVSSIEVASTQCSQVAEELEKTRAEVEKLLVSLRKH